MTCFTRQLDGGSTGARQIVYPALFAAGPKTAEKTITKAVRPVSKAERSPGLEDDRMGELSHVETS